MSNIEALTHGEITVLGRLAVASNATLLVKVDEVTAVYKPIAGEQPLWDFPDQTLAYREVAAFEVSEALGWGIVPTTVLREGPYGLGAVQQWIEIDEGIDLIEMAQSDDERLARIALFDAAINNTDRKISHLLPQGNRIYGCDHGVTFHVDDKLRTVLWQWRGRQIPESWLADLSRLDVPALKLPLSDEEILAFEHRINRLLKERTFPQPSLEWPAVPWPPL